MKRIGIVALAAGTGLIVLAGCSNKSQRLSRMPCGGDCGKSGPCVKASTADLAKWTSFGDPMRIAADKTVCADKALADPDKYAGRSVRVCGKVESVCARMGCWIRLAGPSADETLFVRFTCPVKGRLVPTKAEGRMAIVEGTFEVKEISEAEARHYQEDAGASAEEIAKIQGPQKQITLKAPAAIIDLG